MKIAGIVLIVLQVLAIIGTVIAGRNPFKAGLLELIGYFSLGIIGVTLLIIYYVKKNKK